MIKYCFYSGSDPRGPGAIPLFVGATDPYFEKVAAPKLMPGVAKYIAGLKPRADAQYMLINALGAGEYWGANINSDHFPEAALVHAPDDWTGDPEKDKPKAKDWAYGYPTFYNAKPFLHHKNKPFPPHNHPYFGEVELVLWNPRMKRVELVSRIDKDLCMRGGGMGFWDKLKAGGYPDVSMGTHVPFDTSSITLDWDTYRKAEATFDPRKHRSPGTAILAYHKKLLADGGRGIRGLSITVKDYDPFTKANLGRILPDGRRVFVYNDYPNFFDISGVFIGADRTAKAMMKIADGQELTHVARSFGGFRKVAAPSSPGEKVASAGGLELAFLGKDAASKAGEITKRVIPSQFAGKAIPLLTKTERPLPDGVLDVLGSRPLEEALSTATGLGIVLRPHEFQTIALRNLGQPSLADQLQRDGLVFPRVEDKAQVSLGPGLFSEILAKILMPFLSGRSAFGPYIEGRCVMVGLGERGDSKSPSSLSTPLLRKISAAYNGYRTQMLDLVAESQNLLSRSQVGGGTFAKLAHCPVTELFTPLSVIYLRDAFLDEVGGPTSKQAKAGVEREDPRGTRDTSKLLSGDPS